MIARKNRPLFLLSLRVLSEFMQRVQPSARDLLVLRRHAEPSETNLPLDELCCALIRRELGTAHAQDVAA